MGTGGVESLIAPCPDIRSWENRTVKCPHCGARTSDDVAVCGECGFALHGFLMAEYASVSRRNVALWLDLALTLMLGQVVERRLAIARVLAERLAAEHAGFVVWAAVLLLYGVVTESTLQATPGKRVLRIEVLTTDGGRPSFGRCLGRNLLKLATIAAIVPIPVSIWMARWSERKQSLHDRLARCVVVRT